MADILLFGIEIPAMVFLTIAEQGNSCSIHPPRQAVQPLHHGVGPRNDKAHRNGRASG